MDASKYEVFARCLNAGSGAPCLEQPGMLYLVYEDDGDLVEQLMNGPELVDQDIIASSVRKDTAAAYLYLSNTNRFAFYADEDDILQFYVYQDSGWTLGSLGPFAGQKLLPGRKLHACSTPEGLRVYFQDGTGSIRGLALAWNDGAWTDLGIVPGKPREGTPLSVVFVNDNSALYLYYLSGDESLHCVSISYPGGTFKETVVPGPKFDDLVGNILVLRARKDEETEVIALSANRVIRLDGMGKMVEIGKMDGRKFTATKSDQYFDMIFAPFMQIYAPGWGIGMASGCCVQ